MSYLLTFCTTNSRQCQLPTSMVPVVGREWQGGGGMDRAHHATQGSGELGGRTNPPINPNDLLGALHPITDLHCAWESPTPHLPSRARAAVRPPLPLEGPLLPPPSNLVFFNVASVPDCGMQSVVCRKLWTYYKVHYEIILYILCS